MLLSLEITAGTRTKIGGGVAVLAAAGLALSAGLWGAIAGLAVVVTWLIAGTVYAFAVGQVLFVSLVPDPTRLQITVAQAGLFGFLVAPELRDVPLRTVGAFAVSSAGLIGITAGVRDVTGRLWPAMIALGATVVLCGYGLHRYQLVTLDLVEADA